MQRRSGDTHLWAGGPPAPGGYGACLAARCMTTPEVTITDVQVILTQPGSSRLVIVKVLTSEPGLYGLGCATFTQRIFAVEAAIERHLKPFLIGRDVDRIEELWQMSMVHGYWRNGPGAQQCHFGSRPGTVGHQGQAGRHAGVPTPRRQGPGGGRRVRPRRWCAIRTRSRTTPAGSSSRDSIMSGSRWAGTAGVLRICTGRRGAGRQLLRPPCLWPCHARDDRPRPQ